MVSTYPLPRYLIFSYGEDFEYLRAGISDSCLQVCQENLPETNLTNEPKNATEIPAISTYLSKYLVRKEASSVVQYKRLYIIKSTQDYYRQLVLFSQLWTIETQSLFTEKNSQTIATCPNACVRYCYKIPRCEHISPYLHRHNTKYVKLKEVTYVKCVK